MKEVQRTTVGVTGGGKGEVLEGERYRGDEGGAVEGTRCSWTSVGE